MNKNPYNNPLKFNVDTSNNTPKVLRRPSTFRYRYPRLFVAIVTIGSLSVFFSKPLYDILLNDQTFDIEELKREHQPRYSK